MSAVYVSDHLWLGHVPDGAAYLPNLGEAQVAAAHIGTAPWPAAEGKVVSIDHESKFWMLGYGGGAWSSAAQAASWLDGLVASAVLAYPDAQVGLYGLPFVPYGERTPEEQSLIGAWVREYQGRAIARSAVVLPSIYPAADPEAVGGREGMRLRVAQLLHAERTLEAAVKIAAGREVVAFSACDYPDGDGGTPGRLLKPIDYRFQAVAAKKAGTSLCLWSAYGWRSDVACMPTWPPEHPLAALQARHRAYISSRIGPVEWEGVQVEAVRSALRAVLLPVLQAGMAQLHGPPPR